MVVYPVEMLLELTNNCNARCYFCKNKDMITRGFMDMDFDFNVIRQAYNLGVRRLGFYGRGENTLSPILVDCIKYAKNVVGVPFVFITTNGLFKKQLLHDMVVGGLDSVKFSVNAATRKTYRCIHGVDGFGTVFGNVRYARVLRSSGFDFKTICGFVVTRDNQCEVEKARRLFDGLVDELVFTTVHNQSGYMMGNEDLVVTSPEKLFPCGMVWDRVHVLWDGKVSGCCSDYGGDLVMGDLHSSSLVDVVNGESYGVFCHRHKVGDLGGLICFSVFIIMVVFFSVGFVL